MGAVNYGPEVLARMAALCEVEPEREVCGFVVRRRGALEVVPVANAADAYHARAPGDFPRTSRDSFLMDPPALRRVFEELSESGGEIAAVWHSHVEVGAYFSEKDRSDALLDGSPAIPGAEHLVLGVRRGAVTEVRRFRFEGGDFVESPIS